MARHFFTGQAFMRRYRYVSLLAGLLIGLSALAAQPFGQQGNSAAPIGRRTVAAAAMQGRCLTMVSPNYPPALQLHGSQLVELQVVILSNGSVNPVRRVEGPSTLEASAMDAVRLWKYRPYEQDGEAVDVVTTVKVPFTPGKAGGLITHPASR